MGYNLGWVAIVDPPHWESPPNMAACQSRGVVGRPQPWISHTMTQVQDTTQGLKRNAAHLACQDTVPRLCDTGSRAGQLHKHMKHTWVNVGITIRNHRFLIVHASCLW